MPRANLAERMLEIVTTPSRAASIVGDLEEEASSQNSLWFWFNFLRIFVAHILHTRWAQGRPIEKGWKRLSLVLAVFTFVLSAATFVEHYPMREFALCAVLAAAVFGLVRLGLLTVRGFYERAK